VVLLQWAICLDENFLKEVRNARIFQKWFHCNRQPAQIEDEKSFQRGLIMVGDLPR
jgi:hypothetical protein